MEDPKDRSTPERVLPTVFSLSSEEEGTLLSKGFVVLKYRNKDNARWIGQRVRVDGEKKAHDVRVVGGYQTSEDSPDWEFRIVREKPNTQE